MAKKGNQGQVILRLGLGLFLLMFGLSKFTMADFWLKTYPMFYNFSIAAGILTIFGVIQVILALMLIFGWKVKLATGLGGIMHLSTTVVTLNKIITPFGLQEGAPPNILFFAAVPILAAFIALFLESQ